MTGTLINVGAVVVGAAAGTLLGDRLPERVRVTAMHGLGLMVLVIGMQKALTTANPLIPLASVLIGGVVGELLRIDDGLNWLAGRLQRLVVGQPERTSTAEAQPAGTGDGRFARGFVMASLVFCVGPMTVLGSIEDGLRGDYSTLAVKSMLDGFGAIAFASTLGIGVAFSALSVLVYQGALTLGAGVVRPLLTEPVVTEMSATGGLLILGIGLTLLEIKAIRVSNLLPAIVVAPLLITLSLALFGRVVP